jgi:hypothetical protein
MDQQQLSAMNKLIIPIIALFTSTILEGQDLLSALDNQPEPKDYTIATFKGTRLINFHTIETLSKGSLEVRIAHRFGSFSSGASNLYGLDGPATIQLRIDYALTNRLMVGIGRGSDQKVVDGFVKYRLLRQRTNGSMPVSLTGLATANMTTMPNSLTQDRYLYSSSRMSYLASIMVARKFNSRISLQLSPIYTHFNLVDNLTDKNDLLSLAGSFRYKFGKRFALTLEYVKRLTPYTRDMTQYHDVLGVGFDIETGGHVFQLFVTNGYSINDARTIAYTTTGVKNGLMLGFNISRVFSLTSK